MGTPGAFSTILHRATDFYAAWYPVANVWSVGDFGLVSDGVLVRTGNIRDLGLDFSTLPTPPVKGFDVSSEGTKVRKFLGEAEVNALPDSDIEARVAIEFSKKDSFLLKAATLEVTEMDRLDAVAEKLAQLKDRRWRRKYRVVYATAKGLDMALVSAQEAGAKFEIRGKADALKQLDLGNAQAGLELSSSSSLGLDFVGESGIVGLRMFKLGPWRGGLKVLGPGDTGEVGIEQDFGDTPDDDV
jgi:hypothetical protein